MNSKYPFELFDLDLYILDFRHVENNASVRGQGCLLCIKTGNKGFFSPILQRYPSRQDLARIQYIDFSKMDSSKNENI